MSVTLMTEHHLEFLSLKAGCTSSSESTPVKKQHCWKSHGAAHLLSEMYKSYTCFMQINLESDQRGAEGQLVERLTSDQSMASSRHTNAGVTVLCSLARRFIHYLVLVQSKKT